MFFCFLCLSEGVSRSSFAVFFAPFLKQAILNDIAHQSIIPAFTVLSFNKGNRTFSAFYHIGSKLGPSPPNPVYPYPNAYYGRLVLAMSKGFLKDCNCISYMCHRKSECTGAILHQKRPISHTYSSTDTRIKNEITSWNV